MSETNETNETNETYRGEYVSIPPFIAMHDNSEEKVRISQISVNPVDSSLILTFQCFTGNLDTASKYMQARIDTDILNQSNKTDIQDKQTISEYPENWGRSNFLD